MPPFADLKRLASLSNQQVVEDILAFCRQRQLKLAIAESLTGGALTAEIVAVPGASKVLLGSVVAYQTEIKHGMLGVSQQLLKTRGAVDPDVADQMALGAQRRFAEQLGLSPASVVGLATTGVAGPEAQDGKPVGLVYLAIADSELPSGVQTFELHLTGDRSAIREQAVDLALLKLREHFVI